MTLPGAAFLLDIFGIISSYSTLAGLELKRIKKKNGVQHVKHCETKCKTIRTNASPNGSNVNTCNKISKRISLIFNVTLPFWEHYALPFWYHCMLPFWEHCALPFWYHYEQAHIIQTLGKNGSKNMQPHPGSDCLLLLNDAK